MANRIQLRRGTAAQWTAANPVLAQGEPGIETDTGKQKFGNGVSAWAFLPYASQGPTGPQGTPGIADDASLKALVENPASQTAIALNATIVDVAVPAAQDAAASYLASDPAVVAATELALKDALTSTVTSGPDVVAYGDSLTYGEGGGATTYPATVAALTGLTVVNAGIRAEKSSDIAGRQGGSPLMALVTGGSIPASGPVALTVTRASDGAASADFTRLNTYEVNPVTIAGVEGTITNTSGTYSFTRTTAGTAVTAARPVPIITKSARNYGKHLHIIWAGTNNWLETDQVLGDIESMIQKMDAINKRFLIIGPFNRTSSPSGSADHTAILALEQKLAKQYGRRFINIRRYLIQYGLADAAITPTATDNTNIAADVIPDSLRVDSVHLNAAGYLIVGQQVAARLEEFDWIHFDTVPLVVTGVAAAPGNAKLTVTWTAPNDGGTPITDYTIQYKLNSSGTWLTQSHVASTALTATITGLTNGSLYDVRVAAVNALGTGPFSTVATGTPAAPAVPTFNPLSFTETHLWYDPSNGTDGAAITTTLDDKSTNNYDTVTVGGTPTFSATALDGTPGIAFNGSSWIKSPVFTSLGTVPVTIIFNAKATATSSQYFVDGGTAPNILAVYRSSGAPGQYGIRRNSSAGASVGGTTDANPHTFVAVFNGASSALYVDGVMVASGDQGTVSAGTQIILGGYGGGTPANMLTGAIGDYVLIKKALTTQEIADATYWGKYRRGAV